MMRCSCYQCDNNNSGYCGCVDTIEIDEDGVCSDMWIRVGQPEDREENLQ